MNLGSLFNYGAAKHPWLKAPRNGCTTTGGRTLIECVIQTFERGNYRQFVFGGAAGLPVPEFPRSTCMPPPAASSLSVPEFPRSTCMPSPRGDYRQFLLGVLPVYQSRNFRAALACPHLSLPVCQSRNFRAVFACRHLPLAVCKSRKFREGEPEAACIACRF